MILYRGVHTKMIGTGDALRPRGGVRSEKLFHGHGYYGSGQRFGQSLLNSMFWHQLNSGRYRRGYLSFSKSFAVARKYALGEHPSGRVVEVDTDGFPSAVGFMDLSTTGLFLKIPSDQEVLVWTVAGGALPDDLVQRWHDVRVD